MFGQQEKSLKKCKKCGKLKDESEFHYAAHRLDRRQSRCKKCTSDANRNNHLFNFYGMTLLEYNKMLEEQNEVCAICKQPEVAIDCNGKIRILAVDHCHKTMKVRGLLCNKCNLALGHVEDDIEILRAMITYLEQL